VFYVLSLDKNKCVLLVSPVEFKLNRLKTLLPIVPKIVFYRGFNVIVFCGSGPWNYVKFTSSHRLSLRTRARAYCTVFEGIFKSFRTGRLERELQMVQFSATRCNCIAIL